MEIEELQRIKAKFGIIGNNAGLNHAIEIATQVAATDLSVLVIGESGVGKEFIPQVIHTGSPRKHGVYIAVNCGAIPEGTIDSELFGHEKGSFTGATEARKGYFEEANGGTLFLDEVAELPLSTQVRLLRVLQTGEFIKVGSSKVQKTNVRVIAATNINLQRAIETGKFREDLYYRLNTVPIRIPSLRERPEDIHILFKKFALDFADKYKVPVIRLNADAVNMLVSYRWPGNVRQLKSVAEQISVLEQNREISAEVLAGYLPAARGEALPIPVGENVSNSDYAADRDIIFKILLGLRQDIDGIKQEIEQLKNGGYAPSVAHAPLLIDTVEAREAEPDNIISGQSSDKQDLSIQDASKELIIQALERHGGKRKPAAAELGISERTLYRKIKEFDLE